jgi:hypothetical protein
MQNRSEGCIFSPTCGRKLKALFGSPGGGSLVPISGSPIWAEPSTLPLDHTHENVHTTLEKKGSFGFLLPGRHLVGGKKSPHIEEGFGFCFANLPAIRDAVEHEKICLDPCPRSGTFGFSFGLKERFAENSTEKIGLHSEGAAAAETQGSVVPKKNGFHVGKWENF